MKHFLLLAGLLLTLTAHADTAIKAGASFDAGFSPNAGALELVLKAIAAAKREVRVAAYLFTSKPVAKALLAAHQHGVDVRVVADQEESSKQYSAAAFLANQGVPVRLNGHYTVHHHKFIVIDGSSLELGSFNFTSGAASKNAENVLVLWHVPELASVYAKEWQRLWDEAVDLKPSH